MQFRIFPCSLLAILIVAIKATGSRSAENGSKYSTNRPLRGNFTDKSSHETTSASLLEVFHGPTGSPDPQEQQAVLHHQRQESHPNTQFSFHPAAYGHEQPVALGAESQPPNASAPPAHEDPNGPPPQVLIADGNTIMPADVLLQPPLAASDPNQLAMMPSTYQGASQPEQQVLASLYIDQFGNQQLGIPRFQQQPQQQEQQPNGPPRTGPMRSASKPAHNFYGPQSPRQIGLHARPRGRGSRVDKLRLGDKMKFPSEQPVGGQPEAPAKLTNKQLMSLIDELKEFNSKQASNLRAKDAPSSRKKQDEQVAAGEDDADIDIDIDPTNVETRHTDASQSANGAPKEAGQKDKINTDDLAKFAKFLMTKEGSNMRFQLGLEKDAPDDGDHDEDDRDPLLESKRRTSKVGAKAAGKINSSKELNELDERHNQVSDQMDKLLENLTGTLNEASKNKKNKRRPSSFESDADDEPSQGTKRDAGSWRSKRSRSERLSPSDIKTQVVAETIKQPEGGDGQTVVLPLREKGHDDNFARQLIEQELQQDQLESKLRSEHGKSPPDRRSDQADVVKPVDGKEARRKGRQVDRIQISGGNENERYSKAERSRDRAGLMRELSKSRASKAKLRSGSSVSPREPIVRQALEGGIGLEAQSEPDGNLVLRTGRGHSMRLKLPKRGDTATRVTHSSSDGEEAESASDQNEKAAAAGDDGGNKLARVKLASEKPLKDEYPISERVSSGLNALSNNLDRYFNDGFIGEIKPKSKLADRNKSKPGESGEQQQQASPSNINESAASEKEKRAAEGDQDFDVNVGIDGKREPVDKDEEYDYETDEGTRAKADSGRESEAAKEPKKEAAAKVNSRMASKKRVDPEKRSRKLAKEPSPNAVQGVSSEPRGNNEKLDDELAGGTMKQNLSAADEHMTFENHDSPIPGKVDPVEGESFDSPIGPDGDNLELHVPASADRKVESSRESKNVLTSHGKRVFAPKFYEEPEWR